MKYVRTGRELLNYAKDLSNWIKGDKKDYLRIECMNSLGIYKSTVHVDNRFSRWVSRDESKTKKFPKDKIYSINVYGMNPHPVKIDDAVISMDDHYLLDLSHGIIFDSLSLEVAYRMDEEWLRGLVHARSSPEPLDNTMKYNLMAQLSNPTDLNLGFSRVDVEDYPITARVHIQESISTNIPKYVTELAKIEAEILDDYDPRHGTKIMQLQRKKAELRTHLGKKGLIDKMRELSRFLRPRHFLDYVNSFEDFRLHCCEWGDEYFRTIEMLSFPKSMEITTRTDLSLKKPAAHGYLEYEFGRFEKDVSVFFE